MFPRGIGIDFRIGLNVLQRAADGFNCMRAFLLPPPFYLLKYSIVACFQTIVETCSYLQSALVPSSKWSTPYYIYSTRINPLVERTVKSLSADGLF